MTFPFERLLVYQKAVQFLEKAEELNSRLKGKVSFSNLDRLARASASVPLNIAEGSGRWFMKERAQFFRIARGSVFEIVPLIQMFRTRNAITDKAYSEYYSSLEEMAKMLTGLIKSTEKAGSKKD